MKAFASKSYFCRHHVHSNIYPLKMSYSDGSLSNASTISFFIAYLCDQIFSLPFFNILM